MIEPAVCVCVCVCVCVSVCACVCSLKTRLKAFRTLLDFFPFLKIALFVSERSLNVRFLMPRGIFVLET